MYHNPYKNDYFILPIGVVNFTTGKNAMFGNVFNCWEESGNETYLLCKSDAGKFRAVITCDNIMNTRKYHPIGDRISFRHDQTFAFIGTYEVVALVPNTKEGLLQMKEISGKKSCPFATFK